MGLTSKYFLKVEKTFFSSLGRSLYSSTLFASNGARDGAWHPTIYWINKAEYLNMDEY